MAAIVNEGVGGGGELFAGKKFYILQNVPIRNTWKKLVEGNGGQLVQLEKLADYVIADHAKKDAPPGSFSWKWIEDSVKNGRLQDLEEHRAGAPVRVVREVGSVQRTRRGRTPFTAEDDQILMDWVMAAERKGLETKGNKLYMQLEQKNPRHTSQSWRDRWIKYVSNKSRPLKSNKTEAAYSSPKGLPARRQATGSSAYELEQGQPESSSLVRSHSVDKFSGKDTKAPSPKAASQRVKSAAKSPFTETDIQLLLDSYDDIMNVDEDQFIDAWMAWYKAYPSHTAQEWSNYFKKNIIPMKEPEKEIKREEEIQESMALSGSALPPKPDSKPINSKKEPSKVIEITEPQRSSGKTLNSHSEDDWVADTTTIDERLFQSQLNELAEEIEIEVNFNPVICGRKISLFRLWQVVCSPQFNGYDNVHGLRLWPKVAKALNFNEFKHSTAANDLSVCYSEILAEFEQMRKEYRKANPELTESQENILIEAQLLPALSSQPGGAEEQLLVDEGHQNDSLENHLRKSRNSAHSSFGKRNANTEWSYNEETYNKRQKIDKGKGPGLEIPSTPEEIPNGTLSKRKNSFPIDKRARFEPELEEGEDILSDSLILKHKPPPSSRRPQTKPEPEMQGFEFAIPDELIDRSSFVSISSPASPPDKANKSDSQQVLPEESPTQSQNDFSDAEDITTLIEHWVSLGFDQDVVVDAFQATTMEKADVGFVIQHLSEGNRIPDDMPGVWTADDDDILNIYENSVEFKRLLRKHGAERIVIRRNFLKDSTESNEEV